MSDGGVEAVERGDVPEAPDLGDVTLLPGLVDAHVHLAFDAAQGADIVGSFDVDDEALLERVHHNAAEQLRRA